LLETFDKDGKPTQREHTVTEAISTLGACLLSSLEVEPGRVVRITSVTDGITVFGAIRSRQTMPDGIARLGIEFIGDRWPLGREASFLYQHAALSTAEQPTETSSQPHK
jgi:hypothetical protein